MASTVGHPVNLEISYRKDLSRQLSPYIDQSGVNAIIDVSFPGADREMSVSISGTLLVRREHSLTINTRTKVIDCHEGKLSKLFEKEVSSIPVPIQSIRSLELSIRVFTTDEGSAKGTLRPDGTNIRRKDIPISIEHKDHIFEPDDTCRLRIINGLKGLVAKVQKVNRVACKVVGEGNTGQNALQKRLDSMQARINEGEQLYPGLLRDLEASPELDQLSVVQLQERFQKAHEEWKKYRAGGSEAVESESRFANDRLLVKIAAALKRKGAELIPLP